MNFKRRKYSFPPPSPPYNVGPLKQKKKKKKKMLGPCSSYLQKTTNTRTLNGGDREGVGILLFSEVTLFKYNVSTILSPIVDCIHKFIKNGIYFHHHHYCHYHHHPHHHHHCQYYHYHYHHHYHHHHHHCQYYHYHHHHHY